ncbi:MAG TPA: ATP-binding protein [Acidimicrobiia bacterium]|nr:ATP-binding protein [Acidimicrobiia bacterium]
MTTRVRLHATRHAPAAVVALVGLVLTGLTAYSAWSEATEEHADEMAHQGQLVSRLLEETVELAVTQIRSAQAFLEASDDVSAVEFSRFALIQGGSPGMVSLGFARIVSPEDWDEFVRRSRETRPQYVVLDGDRHPLLEPPANRISVPVWYSHQRSVMPGILGVDLAADPLRRAAIERVLDTRRPSITPLVEVLGDPNNDYVEIYSPVLANAGGGPGVVFASIGIFDLLDESAHGAIEGLDIDVSDVTGAGPAEAASGPTRWSDRVVATDRLWEITLTRPAPPGIPRLTITIILAGVAISLLAGVVTSMVSASRRRRRELDDLREVTKQKDIFLASVAHELRTPLTSVVGITALLDGDWRGLDAKEVDDLLGAAHAEASDLADLIDDVLVAGRLQAGAIHYRAETVDIGEEVRRVVRRVSTEHRIDIDLLDAGPFVHADPLRVRQIVRNIVVNGVRYSEGALQIGTEIETSHVLLTIRNDGPPIPAHLEEVLFQPYQEGRERPSTAGSIGLGLPVSRRLAQAMGGDLTYRHVDGWCEFTVRLPAAEVAAPTPAGVPAS